MYTQGESKQYEEWETFITYVSQKLLYLYISTFIKYHIIIIFTICTKNTFFLLMLHTPIIVYLKIFFILYNLDTL